VTIVIMSGGLDSTVLATALQAGGGPVEGLTVDYGQRHCRELHAACQVAAQLGIPLRLIDMAGLAAALPGSALTDPDIAVPDGHYAAESMRATVVPNRNAILLSLAVAVAVAGGHTEVAFGAHAGDHFIYPDCRPAFVDAFTVAMQLGNEGFAKPGFAVTAPFLGMTKAQIVELGAELGAPLEFTWSCYRGGDRHCGTCGTCVERREAFNLASVADPTDYES
jgi:7-cyano-7-deazaguanine synthase